METIGQSSEAEEPGLEREMERLAAELGESHPKVAALSLKLRMDGVLVRALRRRQDRKPGAVPREPQGWTFHGHLLGRDGRGVEGWTLVFHDGRGGRLERLGSAATDAAGGFRLVAVAEASPGERPQVFAHVLAPDGRTIHRDERPLAPAPGRIEYLEIGLAPSER